MLGELDSDAAAAAAAEELQVSLQQDSFQVRRAPDRVDFVGGPPSLHQGGHSLAQVQLLHVVWHRVLPPGHTGVDIYLWKGRSLYRKSREKSRFALLCFVAV